MYNRHPWSLKKSKSWSRFGATSQTALPIQPIWPIFLVDRLNWQCCLAGSSKTAHRILIFSMAMGADYSSELIFNETCAPQFNGRNDFFLASVIIHPRFSTYVKEEYTMRKNLLKTLYQLIFCKCTLVCSQIY